MKFQICSLFLFHACLYALLFFFFIVASQTGQSQYSPEHNQALIHPPAIIIDLAFHIASAQRARAFADINGEYNFAEAKTFTLSLTLYSLRVSITICKASYIFFQNNTER